MGRLHLLEFDQNEDNQFFLCRICQTHITLTQEFPNNYTVDQNRELTGGIFKKLVNVYTLDPEQQRELGARVVADVYCNKCNSRLGIKFTEVPNADGDLRAGNFLLQMHKLQKWNGFGIVEPQE